MTRWLLLFALLATGATGFANRVQADDLYIDCDIEEVPTQGAKISYQETIKFRLIVDGGRAQDNWGNAYNLKPDELEVYLTSEPTSETELVYKFQIGLVDGVLSGSVNYKRERDAFLKATGICARAAPPKPVRYPERQR